MAKIFTARSLIHRSHPSALLTVSQGTKERNDARQGRRLSQPCFLCQSWGRPIGRSVSLERRLVRPARTRVWNPTADFWPVRPAGWRLRGRRSWMTSSACSRKHAVVEAGPPGSFPTIVGCFPLLQLSPPASW